MTKRGKETGAGAATGGGTGAETGTENNAGTGGAETGEVETEGINGLNTQNIKSTSIMNGIESRHFLHTCYVTYATYYIVLVFSINSKYQTLIKT